MELHYTSGEWVRRCCNPGPLLSVMDKIHSTGSSSGRGDETFTHTMVLLLATMRSLGNLADVEVVMSEVVVHLAVRSSSRFEKRNNHSLANV